MDFDEENGSSSSPGGGGSKKSNRKRQRSIWFKNSVRVRETISKTDMTEEEKRNYWWHQDGDYYYDQMMRAVRYNNNCVKNHNQSLKIHRDGSSSSNNYSNLGWVLATTIVVFTLVTTSVYFMGYNGEDDSTIAAAESYKQTDLRQFGFYVPARNT